MGKRHRGSNNFQPSKRHRQAPPTPSECFFCLSNPTLATHLITSIGNDAYLTTAKGPLPTRTTFPSLSFPAHILIIPLTHTPTLSLISPPETRRSTIAEMSRYRDALHAMAAEEGKGELGAVSWEVSRRGGVHAHWQWMPAPVEMCRRGLVEAGFKVEAENEKWPAFEVDGKADWEEKDGERDCFRVWIWWPGDGERKEKGGEGEDEEGKRAIEGENGGESSQDNGEDEVGTGMDGTRKMEGESATSEAKGERLHNADAPAKDGAPQTPNPNTNEAPKPSNISPQNSSTPTAPVKDSDEAQAKTPANPTPKPTGTLKVLTLPLLPSFRFDLQFGRRVMAMLLGLESRLQWQDCGQSQAEETADVEAFKKAFRKFDFSLEG